MAPDRGSRREVRDPESKTGDPLIDEEETDILDSGKERSPYKSSNRVRFLRILQWTRLGNSK